MSDALLVLEDGEVFRGTSFGATGTATGEAVFTTGMIGYEEVLTDPSFRGQVVTMTVPHVGNYGMNPQDRESDAIQVAGFVVREAARRPSSWRAIGDLRSALAEAGVVAIEGVDTRRLTRHLRDRGAMRCAVSTEVLDADALVALAQADPGMLGRELVSEVSTTSAFTVDPVGPVRARIAAIDFGLKRSMLRGLTEQGLAVHVLPSTATADDVRAVGAQGLFLTNGPGDPATVAQGIATTRDLLGEIPVFGICLGSQLLGHAVGADTYKLTFGHRGVNQPVLRRHDGVVEITSHNHGFAVDPRTIGEEVAPWVHASPVAGRVEVSHVNLNDDVCEGLTCLDVPAFSVQYHPEAAPGPHDAWHLFARFAGLIDGFRDGTMRNVHDVRLEGVR
jgi:carbamoyl-phosphate synthase small subunit